MRHDLLNMKLAGWMRYGVQSAINCRPEELVVDRHTVYDVGCREDVLTVQGDPTADALIPGLIRYSTDRYGRSTYPADHQSRPQCGCQPQIAISLKRCWPHNRYERPRNARHHPLSREPGEMAFAHQSVEDGANMLNFGPYVGVAAPVEILHEVAAVERHERSVGRRRSAQHREGPIPVLHREERHRFERDAQMPLERLRSVGRSGNGVG
jgi:hypothetical protein